MAQDQYFRSAGLFAHGCRFTDFSGPMFEALSGGVAKLILGFITIRPPGFTNCFIPPNRSTAARVAAAGAPLTTAISGTDAAINFFGNKNQDPLAIIHRIPFA
ncbi:MAG: hypothetical protein GY846_18245 [Deltaproteobacteria bacterium]|nr:hypothetical protein [Deltaproteobacteria bacterium]